MPILGIIASSIMKAINDTFTRANSATLGTATSGQAWTSLRGTWTITSNLATDTTDLPTVYPLSSIQAANTNLTMQVASMGNGPGIAFWVTDANNWWAVFQDRTDTVIPASYYAGVASVYSAPSYYAGYYYAGTPASYYAGDPSVYVAPSFFAGGYVTGFSQYLPPSYYAGYYYAGLPASYYAGTPAVYSAPSYYAGYYYAGVPASYYAGSTTYAYSLNLIKAVAGTISSVATQALGATASAALRVITSGVGITATGYTDTLFATQNGTALANTATGATTTSKTGIIIAPSTNGQTSTIASFTAK